MLQINLSVSKDERVAVQRIAIDAIGEPNASALFRLIARHCEDTRLVQILRELYKEEQELNNGLR